MGLLPAGLLTACNREATPPAPPAPAGDATQQVQTDAASGALADASPDAALADASRDEAPRPAPGERVERRDAGGGAWHVDVRTEVIEGGLARQYPGPSCPGGRYCLPAGPPVARPAPVPFADCASTTVPPTGAAPGRFDSALTQSERAATGSSACCYAWSIPCPGGRPLRVGERVFRAAPTARDDWASRVAPDARAEEDEAVRAELAAYWLEQAAAEHASVASFNRFALQLLALGAPSEMLTATLDAARDEVRHAELCYGLAARYSGRPVGPGKLALPTGPLDVEPVAVALETLRDGCLGESVAAELAREASAWARDPEVATVLEGIAADEERHAELAWRAVAWLVAEHGEPVRAAVVAFAASLAGEREAARGDDSVTDLATHGAPGARRQHARRSAVIREIVLPCLEALAGPSLAA
ncbi:MAG: ferritin-like domain-containing protein [Labilithrix sp.]|nr:ferritin-like domain-containing protein [Labilithrix sp.]MBX3214644.1 ferritin-like domain-containing protein [Labilithrix sp.]